MQFFHVYKFSVYAWIFCLLKLNPPANKETHKANFKSAKIAWITSKNKIEFRN